MKYQERLVKKPALLWKRVLAYTIDMLAVVVAISPLKNFLNMQNTKLFETYEVFAKNPETLKHILPLMIFVLIVTVLYFTILEFKFRQTLGKMLMNIYVESAVKNERHFEHFLLRNLSKISGLLLAIDSLPLFFSYSNQRYLERIAGTIVIQEEREVKLR